MAMLDRRWWGTVRDRGATVSLLTQLPTQAGKLRCGRTPRTEASPSWALSTLVVR